MNIKIIKKDGWEKIVSAKSISFDGTSMIIVDHIGRETILSDREVSRIDMIDPPKSYYTAGLSYEMPAIDPNIIVRN